TLARANAAIGRTGLPQLAMDQDDAGLPGLQVTPNDTFGAEQTLASSDHPPPTRAQYRGHHDQEEAEQDGRDRRDRDQRDLQEWGFGRVDQQEGADDEGRGS